MQIDAHRIRAIASELEDRNLIGGAGHVATIATSLLVSLIPVVGGTASYLVDKVGTRLVEPDHAANTLDLTRAILAIAPEIERIATLEDTLTAISDVIRAHGAILDKFRSLAEGAAAAVLDAMELNNRGGLQNVVDVMISDMRIESTTHAGGISTFQRVNHDGGSSRFETESGATTTISQSSFKGRRGGTEGSVTYNGPVTNHGAVQEHNVEHRDGFAALRVRASTNDQNKGVTGVRFVNGKLDLGGTGQS